MTARKTMIERAMAEDPIRFATRPVSEEEIEVFWAWIRGRITLKQAGAGYGKTTSRVYVRFMHACRHLIERGDLVPEKMLQDIEASWED